MISSMRLGRIFSYTLNMKAHKNISVLVKVYKEYLHLYDTKNLNELQNFINFFQNQLNSIPEEYRKDATISLFPCDSEIECEIFYIRKKTEEELTEEDRLIKEKTESDRIKRIEQLEKELAKLKSKNEK